MILGIPLIHLCKIIDNVVDDDGKFLLLGDELVVFRVLHKTNTHIIKVIRHDWMQNLNGILVVNIVTSIITRQQSLGHGIPKNFIPEGFGLKNARFLH